MLKRIAEKVVNGMMKYGTIPREEKELYVFGVYQTIISGIEILLMLVTGIFWNVAWQCVSFLIVFMVLRRYAGGFHASTLPRCVLMSWSMVCIGCIWAKNLMLDTRLQIALLLFSGIFIILFAPIPDVHKKLYDYEIQKYRRFSLEIWLVYVMAYVVLWKLDYREFAQCIVIGIAMVLLVMIMSMPWRKRLGRKRLEGESFEDKKREKETEF